MYFCIGYNFFPGNCGSSELFRVFLGILNFFLAIFRCFQFGIGQGIIKIRRNFICLFSRFFTIFCFLFHFSRNFRHFYPHFLMILCHFILLFCSKFCNFWTFFTFNFSLFFSRFYPLFSDFAIFPVLSFALASFFLWFFWCFAVFLKFSHFQIKRAFPCFIYPLLLPSVFSLNFS